MNSLSQLMTELNRLDQALNQELANLSGHHTVLQTGLRDVALISPVSLKLEADVRKLAQRVADLQILITALMMRSRQLEAGPLTTWTAPGPAGSLN